MKPTFTDFICWKLDGITQMLKEFRCKHNFVQTHPEISEHVIEGRPKKPSSETIIDVPQGPPIQMYVEGCSKPVVVYTCSLCGRTESVPLELNERVNK